MNNLILPLFFLNKDLYSSSTMQIFVLNKLQSRRKCGSSSILKQALHSRSSLLSFLYLPLSITRVCALILSLVRLFLLFSFFIVNM